VPDHDDEKIHTTQRGTAAEWLCRAEGEIQALLRVQEEKGGLCGINARKEAAQRLNVSTLTVDQMMKRYAANPGIDALIPSKHGANPGHRLTDRTTDC
jgi:hypothetical protein